ncbi:catechol 2,3-dioxygenase-like lactoylglutathione lyase family enzyme [Microvirga flocculans]|uniref:Catechol 2,3-dioxygenase-like lactoylglutathione lyase family enzyme n=1 Tax=Microvirga flocculans TaxID=217168 RepID=A0A7W6N7C0_9HYPH|nr:VOC family protein [Microvirga flocculans]MBB4039512.1 catechol 2,3-dioxygenase-like lactoylglutathione lyase family enzyme [Microvirga flocculans]
MKRNSQSRSIGAVTFLIRDYDEAVAYFTKVLDFATVSDTSLPDGRRWIVVAPPGGPGLVLVKAETAEEKARIGDQAAGRAFLFLHTDDFQRDYNAMRARGVTFCEEPRSEPYGTVAIFRDLYGNYWDLKEPPV